MTNALFSPLLLPNGRTIPNRLAKAAMEENMAVDGHLPGDELFRLYEAWADGGVGLIITGNVMIDHRAMTGPGGIALEDNTPIDAFKQWANVGRKQGAEFWMQINHPGRQVYAALGGKVWSPSDVPMDMGKHSTLFSRPTPMTEVEIHEVIKRFATTAIHAAKAGFTGVQIHAAHGYLLSQFLSPLTNKRTDQWGGSLDNRARILFDIVKAVKAAVPNDFAVSVKLNSADFQRGGFDSQDAKKVVAGLGDLKVDLVELSGGSYESPAMQGQTADGRTLDREAYFLEFAKDIANEAIMPVMTTGGIKRLAIAERVLSEGVDMVGMGTALAFNPGIPNEWRQRTNLNARVAEVNWKDKVLRGAATMAIVKRQLQRVGRGKRPKFNPSPLFTLIRYQIRFKKLARQYRSKYSN